MRNVVRSENDANAIAFDASDEDSVSGGTSIATIPSSYTVESSRMRRYILEDIISAPVGERVVVCVEPKKQNNSLEEHEILAQIALKSLTDTADEPEVTEAANDKEPVGTEETGGSDDSSPAEALVSGNDEENDDDPTTTLETTANQTQQTAVVIEQVVMAGKTKKICKHPVHSLASKDSFALGRGKMQEMNIVAKRHRAKCRAKRERKALLDDLYIFTKATRGGCSEVLTRLESAITEEDPDKLTAAHRLSKVIRELRN